MSQSVIQHPNKPGARKVLPAGALHMDDIRPGLFIDQLEKAEGAAVSACTATWVVTSHVYAVKKIPFVDLIALDVPGLYSTKIKRRAPHGLAQSVALESIGIAPFTDDSAPSVLRWCVRHRPTVGDKRQLDMLLAISGTSIL